MVQFSAIRRSFIAILWISLVSFAAVTLCVASQRLFVVVSVYEYFVIDSVRKLLDTPLYLHQLINIDHRSPLSDLAKRNAHAQCSIFKSTRYKNTEFRR
jgi:hypothetical protein